jgi:alcohol dehydrogenase, propanol-preferring
VLRSVANSTRRNGEELFAAIRAYLVTTTVEVFPLEDAERALDKLRAGAIRGAAVLSIAEGT